MNEELYEYLSEQYMACVTREDELIQKKYQLQSKQRKYEENLYFYAEDETKRQLFTPLVLKTNHAIHELSKEQFHLSENGRELESCEKELRELDKVKKKLKSFIHDLTQQSMQFDEFHEKEENNILFFPAFYELIEHTDQQFPEVTFVYDKPQIHSKYLMTFGFLTTWKELFRYCNQSLILDQIHFQIMNDRDKTMISMKFSSKVPIGKNVVKRIENLLSKDYYLQAWRKDGFEINIILK